MHRAQVHRPAWRTSPSAERSLWLPHLLKVIVHDILLVSGSRQRIYRIIPNLRRDSKAGDDFRLVPANESIASQAKSSLN